MISVCLLFDMSVDHKSEKNNQPAETYVSVTN